MDIDVGKLSEHLATLWWNEYSYGIDPKKLYDTYVYEGHGMHLIHEIREEYANMFWSKVEDYKEIIEKFKIE